MLFAIDVGNTNTVLGWFVAGDGASAPPRLAGHWRIATQHTRTADEYAVLIKNLFELGGAPWNGMPKGTGAMIATVVPPVLFALEDLCRRHLGIEPLVVGPGIKTGMPILTDSPREVGADRIVNAVAAFERVKGGCIVVDFGTATTFDVVTPKGEYLGGAIAPGVHVSADALYRAAAKLPRVEIVRPPRVTGKNTVDALRSGLLYGYAGLVDGIVERMRVELDFPVEVIATGGLAPLVAAESKAIQHTDELLTLNGMALLYQRNT